MSDQGNRRRFLSVAASAGLVLGVDRLISLLPAANAHEAGDDQPSNQPQQVSDRVDIDYLAKGLSALARAHHVNNMAGHLGAAVVAGYFIAEQHPDLDDAVYEGIEGELDRIIAGQSVFSPKPNASVSVADMFQSFPKEPAHENLVDGIADALAENIDRTRQSGHNVIFAAIAIRALKDHPGLATPPVTDGIRKLIAGFNDESPGSGYYGAEKGRINGRNVTLQRDDAFPPYSNLQAMANAVLDALIQHAADRRVGFGGLTHVINHAAALAELAHYGYRELAIGGLAAHHEHMQLWRTLPNVAGEPGQRIPTKTEHDPRTSAFWQSGELPRDSAKLTHRIKTLYGFDALMEAIENKSKEQEGNGSLRYLM